MGTVADLHTHSTCSDGVDSPADLVRAARCAGLDVVALTDHDATAGWVAAAAEAARVGVQLVTGVELSARWGGASRHLLVYFGTAGPPPERFEAELARLRSTRADRIEQVLAALRTVGVAVSMAAVRAAAGPAVALGRPHVADALVAAGYAASRAEAFDRYLAEGRPGYVGKGTPDAPDAVRLARSAGGVPVLAHPLAPGQRRPVEPAELAALAAAGLAGIEVDHPGHDAAARRLLRGWAAKLDLLVTGGSDYHGAARDGYDLGAEHTAPDQLARLLAQAAARIPTSRSPQPSRTRQPPHP